MDLNTRRLLSSLVLMGAVAFPAFAATDSAATQARAEALFNKGVEAFQRGDLDGAVALLERAREAGKDSVALTYNLGVAHFRTGNLASAERYFRELLEVPEERALARYNLGLVALERDNETDAVRHFSAAKQGDADDRIRGLASEQLARLGEPEEPAAPSRRSGLLLAGLGAGYEDNLNLAGDQTLEEEALFQDGFVWVSQDLARRGDLSLSLTGLGSFREYNGASEADQQLARPGFALDYDAGRWQGEAILDSEWQWLDGDRVERRDRLRAEVSRRLASGWLDFGSEVVNVSAGSRFPELEGRDLGLDAGIMWFWSEAWVTDLTYRFTDEDRDDLRLQDDFFSTSPRRHGLTAQVRFYPEGDWDFRGSILYRDSRYPDPEIRGGVQQERRQEELWRLSSRARYAMEGGWRVTLDAEWETSDASLPSRDYDRFEVRAGIEKRLDWE